MFSSTSRLYLAALDTARQLKVTFFGGFVKIWSTVGLTSPGVPSRAGAAVGVGVGRGVAVGVGVGTGVGVGVAMGKGVAVAVAVGTTTGGGGGGGGGVAVTIGVTVTIGYGVGFAFGVAKHVKQPEVIMEQAIRNIAIIGI